MRKRQGFTIVELLVAMALTLFTMAILSQAFVTSLEVFSQLKGIGDMETGLRGATNLLRADLSQPHFEGELRTSGPNFFANPNRTFDPSGKFMISYTREGFFHIRQGLPSIVEAGDVEESSVPVSAKMLNSYRSNSHVLLFTNRLRGNRKQDYALAPVPLGSPLIGNGTN